MKMKKQNVKCPYCGGIAVLRDASYVYGDKSKHQKLYVCQHYPECNSYVGVHDGTDIPISHALTPDRVIPNCFANSDCVIPNFSRNSFILSATISIPPFFIIVH